MNLVFIYGPMAVGKLTIAEELASRTGYKLFDNHKTVDAVVSLFDFGTPGYKQMIRDIRLSALQVSCQVGLEGMVFTFANSEKMSDDLPGYSPPEFAASMAGLVENYGGCVYPVQLIAPKEVLMERISNDSRISRGKMTSPEWLSERLLARNYYHRLDFGPKDHPCIDTSQHSVTQAATRIIATYGLPDIL